MSNEQLIQRLQADGYFGVRELADGTVAGMGRLLFTTAIYLGMDETGWEFRFCYKDHQLARAEFAKLTSADDVPAGWVARRFGAGAAA